jgi:hypothetical protein
MVWTGQGDCAAFFISTNDQAGIRQCPRTRLSLHGMTKEKRTTGTGTITPPSNNHTGTGSNNRSATSAPTLDNGEGVMKTTYRRTLGAMLCGMFAFGLGACSSTNDMSGGSGTAGSTASGTPEGATSRPRADGTNSSMPPPTRRSQGSSGQ